MLFIEFIMCLCVCVCVRACVCARVCGVCVCLIQIQFFFIKRNLHEKVFYSIMRITSVFDSASSEEFVKFCKITLAFFSRTAQIIHNWAKMLACYTCINELGFIEKLQLTAWRNKNIEIFIKDASGICK